MANSKPNILFLLSDEHSYRFMGHVPENAGGEPVHTPMLDQLETESVSFTNAYCQMPLCTPSRLCILTGLEPRRCGAWWNESVLRPELATLPGTLAKEGYESCLLGKMHLGGTNQFAGFHYRPYGDLTGKTGHQWEPLDSTKTGPYAMRFRTANAGVTEIPESQMQEHLVAEEGLAFVREHEHNQPENPWFLCLSFSRPHFPLTSPRRHFDQYWPEGVTPPKVGRTGDAYDHPMSVGMREGFRSAEISEQEMMKARAGYFACVSYLDEIIGDLLLRMEKSGHLDNTIIVYSSDHGEMAGEHGVWWKQSWHDGCTKVPFLISLPEHRRKVLPASTINQPVGLIDIFPTLCGLANVPYPVDLDGRNLAESIVNQTEPSDSPVFCDNLLPRWGEGTEFRMVREGQYKYVRFRGAEPLMFDLENDPDEQHNLCNQTPSYAENARSRLSSLAEECINFDTAEKERLERDADLSEKYALNVPESTGNLYMMDSGRLVNAEDMLTSPTVILANARENLIGSSTAADCKKNVK